MGASYDFEVDLEALSKSATKTAEAITMMKEHDVEDFVPTSEQLGNAEVWGAVEAFKNRWERGLQDLVGDVEEISGRLGRVTASYGTFEEKNYSEFSALAAKIDAAKVLEGF